MGNSRTLLQFIPSSHKTLPAAAILAGLVSMHDMAVQAASITGLGSLPAAPYGSEATGVSADGSVVVGNSGGMFRWTRDGGMVRLGDESFGGQINSVSADGSVIVGSGSFAAGMTGFRWTSAGGLVSLGLPDGYKYSVVFGVSGDGSVVVGGHNFGGQGEYVPFRWTESEGLVGLGTLPGGSSAGSANAASADGSTIVGASRVATLYQAYRWTHTEGMVSLGSLPGDYKYIESFAHDVSADGAVVVGAVRSDYGMAQTFRWTAAQGMVGLQNFGDLDYPPRSYVSSDGKVILSDYGAGANVDYKHHDYLRGVFLWTDIDGWQGLWDMLLARGVSPQSHGWTQLTEPADISGDGRFVVGTGIRNGKNEAFLVDLQGTGDDDPVISQLEIPADGSDQAGVGIVSGWHCTASAIQVAFDDLPWLTAGSHTTRADTAGICGDADNGFSLLWAYSLLGEGEHTAILYADGVEFARATFNVTLVNGEEFVTGASGAWKIDDFPVPGNRLKVRWDEPSQNLVIFGSEPMGE